jgi:hypothetical protein
MPFYLLLKLFPYAGSNSIELVVMYNLLPSFILAYEACKGEKQNRISKMANLTANSTAFVDKGEPKLRCIVDDKAKLQSLKPKWTNTWPIINIGISL